MRCFVRLVVMLGLGVMLSVGCTSGGGDGGGGEGGMGGNWMGSSCLGLDGIGGMPECASPSDCNDANECTADDCSDGGCEHVAVEDSTPCGDPEAPEQSICIRGNCMPPCETDEDCEPDLSGPDAAVVASARNDCTVAACASNGYCSLPPVQDGTECAGGVCQSGECELSGTVLPCSEQGIRNAIAAGGGPYTFDCDGPTTVATQAQIIIDNDVSLDGEGDLTVDAREVRSGDNVFYLPRWAKAELCGLVVTGAKGETGIAGSGVLAMRNCAVSGNEGGIRNGTIDTFDGSMTLTGVTISGNTCPQDDDCAGGIKNFGSLTMTNCTVSGNQTVSAGGQAAGIFNGGTLMMVNSTVTGNTYAPGEEKGDIFGSYGGTITVANSLIDADCYMEDRAVVLSEGHNIESPGDTCGFDQTGDQPGVTAEELSLGELAANGGPTDTHALLPGSIAIDVIPEAMCEVDTDQRGVTRPQGAACDVGAFELEVTP